LKLYKVNDYTLHNILVWIPLSLYNTAYVYVFPAFFHKHYQILLICIFH